MTTLPTPPSPEDVLAEFMLDTYGTFTRARARRYLSALADAGYAFYRPETHAVLPRVVTEGMVRDFYGAPPHEGPSDNDVSVVQNVLDTFIAAVEGPKP